MKDQFSCFLLGHRNKSDPFTISSKCPYNTKVRERLSKASEESPPIPVLFLTFSTISQSILKAQSWSLAESSLMEERVRRNCSALPRGTSGFASCASWIFCFSSSVGIIVRIFCIGSQKSNISGGAERSVRAGCCVTPQQPQQSSASPWLLNQDSTAATKN